MKVSGDGCLQGRVAEARGGGRGGSHDNRVGKKVIGAIQISEKTDVVGCWLS